MAISRRDLLNRSGGVGLGVVVAGAVDSLFAANPAAGSRGPATGYGPLVEDPRGYLDLPKGFSYRILSREGQPLRSGGGAVPSRFDGQAAFPGRSGRGTILVRNHECRENVAHRVPGPASHTYDPLGPGGTTTLVISPRGELEEEYVSLGGSFVNCAGGRTPWRTWLTCEETESSPAGSELSHGWIFEVDPYDNARNADPTPLKAMGRFQHEATATDPRTGVVYETEDAFDHPFGLFYRFLPEKPLGGYGSLRAGGTLQAMRLPGVSDLSMVTEIGARFDTVEWVDVPDPSAADVPIRFQDFGPGGITHSQKLEGCYWGKDSVYFVTSFARSEDGSTADHDGQVWRYIPERNILELSLIFSFDPDDDAAGEGPDNICLSPYGGLMLAEDGGGEQHLLGVTGSGEVFTLARNRQNVGTPEKPSYGEFAGVDFSADGQTLYANCYNPGTTFAITGPWQRQR
jgi:uncharacterized protein